MNLNIFKPVSIKAKVTLFTLTIFVIGIWSLTYYASRMLRTDMEKLLGEQQLSTASMVAQEIGACVSDRLLALENVARDISPAILDNALSVQALLEQRPLLQIMFNSGVFVTRKDGTSIADVPFTAQRVGKNYLDRDYMIAALKEGKSSIGRPVIGRRTKSPSFAMAVPIRDAQGKVIGALTGATDLGKPNYLDRLAQSRYGTTGGFLLITPQYRQIITATDKKRIMELLPAAGVNRYVDRNIAGYEGYSVLVNARGEEQLASVKQIPGAGWYLLLGTQTLEAFEPIRTMQQRMLLATVILTLLSGGLVWWMMSRMLRRQFLPIITATEMVDTLAAGMHVPQPLPIIRQDEIGTLIGSFNRLLLTLGQREGALKESEENLAITLQSIGDAVIATDVAGRVTRMNPTAENLCGWSLADAIGRPLPEVFRIINADTRATVPDPVHIVMALSQVVGLANHTVLLARDGQEYQIADSAAPIRNAAGEIIGVVLVFSDVTEKYRVERILHESEERYRLLVTNLSAGLVVHGSDTKILFSNPMASTILGLSRGQMLGKQAIDPAWCFIGENGMPLTLEEYPVNRVRVSGESFENQILGIRRPDRPEPVWVLCNGYPVTGAEDALMKVVVTFFDVTERKRIEYDLQAKSAEIEQFIYTVSHDLRSPLVTIKTFMGYLEKDMADGNRESLAQDIALIHGAADKMGLLLDELLELSRIDRVAASLVSISFMEVLAEVVDILAGDISRRTVDIQLPETDLMLFADRQRLHQIWQNLIENAIKYSRDDSSIRIELGVEQSSGEAVFFVRDNGIGIDPRYHDKVFGIFEKMDPKSPGAGLGLSMVQRIVEKAGGRIWVESDGIGLGSCFRFTLPNALHQKMPADPTREA
jgi:PAS domain S-box-containing protein